MSFFLLREPVSDLACAQIDPTWLLSQEEMVELEADFE